MKCILYLLQFQKMNQSFYHCFIKEILLYYAKSTKTKLCIDLVGPLPLTEDGHKFILTTQGDLTKFSYAIPIQNHEAIKLSPII